MEDNNKEISITTPKGETIKGVIDWNKFHKEKEFIEKLEEPLINVFKEQEQIEIDKYIKPFLNRKQ